MIKSKELSDPNSCLNKAKDDEIIFVLLERDKAAPTIIRQWCFERIRLGLDYPGDPKIVSALDTADEMERRCDRHHEKPSDPKKEESESS